MATLKDTKQIIGEAHKVHQFMYCKYNRDLTGKCIEASDMLTNRLNKMGFNARSKQVWVLYEYFEGCTDLPYEEHWITEVELKGGKIYIDLTISQFQWAFYNELPVIYIDTRMPNFFLSRKPGKTTLDKCGWNDWYNYGNYVNNFNYYGK